MTFDIVGHKFGKLTVLAKAGSDKYRHAFLMCKCDCGTIVKVMQQSLRSGATQSCGCLHREISRTNAKKLFSTHGFSRRESTKKFYSTWANILARCDNPNNPGYYKYGGRGIKVCKRWHKFENFRDDMYESYLLHSRKSGEANTTIERINFNGDYKLSNCIWATWKVQARNTRRNRLISYNGKTQTMVEWAEELHLNYKWLSQQINQNKLALKDIVHAC